MTLLLSPRVQSQKDEADDDLISEKGEEKNFYLVHFSSSSSRSIKVKVCCKIARAREHRLAKLAEWFGIVESLITE